MKRLNKIVNIFLILLIISTIFYNVFAAELKTELDIIQKASEIKYLENDQGYISKTIVDSNAETGEVTIELKINNAKKEEEESTQVNENTEIYIMVSENIALDDEKMSQYTKNIESLASKILKLNTKTKIGIIGITGTIADITYDENGNAIFGENDESDVEGTADNAEIVVNLTNNIDVIKSGLQSMNSSKTGYRNNLQAAIRLANKSYSNDVNKILISLYDDVPSIAIGVCSNVTYGGILSEYDTAEEAIMAKHEQIANYTKNEILTLKKSNISFILLRPDDTSYDETWYSTNTGEKILDFDGSPYVQKLYGTMDNPTHGKMYSFDDSNIDTIITENIYQDVKEEIQSNINNIKIVDYFPEDITDNFEFSYVGEPSIGSVTEGIDEETKSITWEIDTLDANETATLKYKLKIKDMKNTELLDKTIATNEKVILTYKDSDGKDYTITLESSPKIQLSEIKEELTATITYDPTDDTTGIVKATIKTNKKVNPVDGWTLSEDGKTLTKTYSKNTTEIVHLVDIDNMEKDVTIKITNIIAKDSNIDNDETTAPGTIPQTGVGITITFAILSVLAISFIILNKYHGYKDIK